MAIEQTQPRSRPPRRRFYLRRLLQSLLEQQKQEALAGLPQCDLLQLARGSTDDNGQQRSGQAGRQQAVPDAGPSGGVGEAGGPPAAAAEDLSPEQAAALSLLEAAVRKHQLDGPGSPPPALVTSVVATLAALSAQALLDVLLRLRRRSPALAAHLLLHGLEPAGWELLSGCMERRQEELAEEGGQLGVSWGESSTC